VFEPPQGNLMTKKTKATGGTKENFSQHETRRDPSPPADEQTRSYFRRLRRRLQGWLLISYALPLLLLVVYFQVQLDFHRRMIIGVTGFLLVTIIFAMIVTTNRLLGKAQRIQESRRELQSQLFQASKLVAVGELAAGVAHEINNPLAIIAAGSGLVRDMLDPEIPLDASPEEIGKELDKIDAAVYRAGNITQTLIKFVSRGEGVPVATNVHDILDEILDGVKMRAFELANIEVERNYDPAMREILLDQDQIRQVFLNLINNAGDAIEGAGKVSLTTRDEGSVEVVVITDTGKGMTTEQMGKIFLPFYTTKEVGKGTGLGLSVSLSIVEALGGRIELQSMPGMGSSFIVVLPARRPERAASGE
jgi:two-component system NtrC family sensor kinase